MPGTPHPSRATCSPPNPAGSPRMVPRVWRSAAAGSNPADPQPDQPSRERPDMAACPDCADYIFDLEWTNMERARALESARIEIVRLERELTELQRDHRRVVSELRTRAQLANWGATEVRSCSCRVVLMPPCTHCSDC